MDRRGHDISNVSATGNTKLLLGDHNQTIYNNNYHSSEASFLRDKPKEERNKMLIKAALEGQHLRLRHLIDACADLDAQNVFSDAALRSVLPSQRWNPNLIDLLSTHTLLSLTALGAAALGNHVQCVELLLDRGADINQQMRCQGSSFDSPLSMSLHARSDEATRILLDYGAAMRDELLCLAIKRSAPVDILRTMINRGIDVNYCDEEDCISPALVEAVLLHGEDHPTKLDYQRAVVDLLLSNGADVNVRTTVEDYRVNSGSTALMIASSTRNGRLVSSLIASGADADVDHQDSRGYTALMRLYEPDCGADWITKATHKSKLHADDVEEVLQLLLKAGADVRLCNDSGTNILMLVAQNSHKEAADSILQRGQDMDAKDNFGRTALMHVLDNWDGQTSPAFLHFMLSRGASVNCKNKQGKSAFLLGSGICDVQELQLFITAGANAKSRDRKGRNALLVYLGSRRMRNELLANTAKSLAKLQLLAEAGVVFTQRDNKDRTALMLAARIGSDSVVEYLSDGYPDMVDERDGSGKSALAHAAEKGFGGCVRILLSRGAELSVDRDGTLAVRNVSMIMRGQLFERPVSLKRDDDDDDDDRHSAHSLSTSDRSDSDIASEDSLSVESCPASPYSFVDGDEDAPPPPRPRGPEQQVARSSNRRSGKVDDDAAMPDVTRKPDATAASKSRALGSGKWRMGRERPAGPIRRAGD